MAWNKFIGQEKVIEILKVYLSNNRIPQSLIFSGMKGVGKFSIAKEFAKAVNCKKEKFEACDSCLSCVQIEKETHPDLFMLRTQGKGEEITIETIRGLEKFLNLSPQVAEKKFFIIDGAERMNIESSNAFLKSLEEPPLDSVIILITTRPENLLSTIKSRCQELKFSPINKRMIQETLEKEYGIDSVKAQYLANISQGSFAKALEFKDKEILSFIEEVRNFFSYQGFGEEKKLELYEKRILLKQQLEVLLFLLRDILFINLGIPKITLLNKEFISEKGINWKGIKPRDLIEKIEKVDYLYSSLESNVNPELVYKVGKQICEEVCF